MAYQPTAASSYADDGAKNKKIAVILIGAAALAWMLWPSKAKATPVKQPPADNAQREIPAAVAPAVTYDTYTVKTGDSLSQIASNFYGDGSKPSTRGNQNWKWWPIIYDLNADVVKHPSKIKAGMVLKIPKKADLPLDKQADYFARAMRY